MSDVFEEDDDLTLFESPRKRQKRGRKPLGKIIIRKKNSLLFSIYHQSKPNECVAKFLMLWKDDENAAIITMLQTMANVAGYQDQEFGSIDEAEEFFGQIELRAKPVHLLGKSVLDILLGKFAYELIVDAYKIDVLFKTGNFVLAYVKQISVMARSKFENIRYTGLFFCIETLSAFITVAEISSREQLSLESTSSRASDPEEHSIRLSAQMGLSKNSEKIVKFLLSIIAKNWTLNIPQLVPLRIMIVRKLRIWLRKQPEAVFEKINLMDGVSVLLFDSDNKVRLEAIKFAQELITLDNGETAYNRKLSKALCDNIGDANDEFAVTAAELLGCTLGKSEDSEREVSVLSRGVFSTSYKLARSCASVLGKHWLSTSGDFMSVFAHLVKLAKEWSWAIPTLVESMIGIVPHLTDWDKLLQILLESQSQMEDQSFVCILTCEAALQMIDINDHARKKKKKKEGMPNMQISIFKRLLPGLTEVVHLFRTEEQIILPILSMVKKIFVNQKTEGIKKDIAAFIDTFPEIVKYCRVPSIYKSVVEIITTIMENGECAIRTSASLAQDKILMYATEIYETNHSPGSEDENESLANALQIFGTFYPTVKLNEHFSWEDFSQKIQQSTDVVYFRGALLCCTWFLIWEIRSIESVAIYSEIEQYRQMTIELKKILEDLIAATHLKYWCLLAFRLYCDLFINIKKIVISSSSREINYLLKKLRIDEMLLRNFVEQNTFCESEESYKLNKQKDIIVMYCTMMSYNYIPIRNVGIILEKYVECKNRYSDVYEEVFKFLSAYNEQLADILFSFFQNLQSTKDIGFVKKVVKSLKPLYNICNRKTIPMIHFAGITLGSDEFLTVLTQLTTYLNKTDAMTCLRKLQQNDYDVVSTKEYRQALTSRARNN